TPITPPAQPPRPRPEPGTGPSANPHIRNQRDADILTQQGAQQLGTGLAIGGVFNPVGIALFGVAGMAGATALTGYCPLYSALGISTRPQPQQD
ncbi:MAG: DUF2892 domain-containing protein, partial [Candidatus Nanopelagicales bacterium]